MKRPVYLLAFALLSLLFLPFAAAAEKSSINFDMDPIFPKKLDPSFYNGKIVLLYYWTLGDTPVPDKRRVAEIAATFQALNRIQLQFGQSGVFTVVGSYVGTDNIAALNTIKQCRPRFPVYASLLCQTDPPKPNQCSFVLIDANGQSIGSGKWEECQLTLKNALPSAMAVKRMKSLPIKHPLEGMNLIGKEIEYYSIFEPGKPWLGAYKKIEKNIEKNANASGSQEVIKTAIDDYLTTTVPEILEKAKKTPAEHYDILNMLGRSVKGMPGDEMVNEALKPLQTDKNVADLAKQITAIKKFKATSNNLNPDQLKKRCESFIAPLKKLLLKPTLTDAVKEEAEKWVAQLEQLASGSGDDPVPADEEAPADNN